jgi:hypothetical protein
MANSNIHLAAGADDASADSAETGDWATIYAIVLGTFVLWVGLLTFLSRAFS